MFSFNSSSSTVLYFVLCCGLWAGGPLKLYFRPALCRLPYIPGYSSTLSRAVYQFLVLWIFAGFVRRSHINHLTLLCPSLSTGSQSTSVRTGSELLEPSNLGRCCLRLPHRLVCSRPTFFIFSGPTASWHSLCLWLVLTTYFRYNLFATNVILASISFVYFPESNFNYVGTLINVFTLLGSVVGQLTFGFLADYYGRTRLYGIELILVIVSTIGVATSNYGYNDLSFLGLFIWVSTIVLFVYFPKKRASFCLLPCLPPVYHFSDVMYPY